MNAQAHRAFGHAVRSKVHALYRCGEVNICAYCSWRQWHVGRVCAECEHCGEVVPLIAARPIPIKTDLNGQEPRQELYYGPQKIQSSKRPFHFGRSHRTLR